MPLWLNEFSSVSAFTYGAFYLAIYIRIVNKNDNVFFRVCRLSGQETRNSSRFTFKRLVGRVVNLPTMTLRNFSGEINYLHTNHSFNKNFIVTF